MRGCRLLLGGGRGARLGLAHLLVATMIMAIVIVLMIVTVAIIIIVSIHYNY